MNTKVFSAHSTRAAAASAAHSNNVPISTIMEAAGWSRESTFQKFYDKLVKSYSNIIYHICVLKNYRFNIMMLNS